MKGKKAASILLLLLWLLAILSACQPPYQTIPKGEQRVYKWRMVTHQIPGTARYEGTIKPFVEAVEEISGGRLVIEPFGANALFPTNETFDMVKNGVVEVAAFKSISIVPISCSQSSIEHMKNMESKIWVPLIMRQKKY